MSATKNMTVRKYHNLKYSKGVSQSKGLSVSIQTNRTANEYQNQKDCSFITSKGAAKDCHIQNDRPGFSQLKGLSMRITIKTTAGESHNQN